MSESRIVRVVVRGRVHGVGFRAWVQHQAELHGLNGWVRNRRDGSVEAVFAGPADEIEAVLKACRTGPRLSRVDDVVAEDADASVLDEAPRSRGFAVLPTV